MTGSSASPFSVSELPPGEVHLWLARSEELASLDGAVLSAAERARSSFATGRCWLRHLLSRYGDVAPGDWEFGKGEHGKPYIEAPESGLEFNLSHSGDWLAAGITAAAPVGVDIQVMDRERQVRRVASRYFPETELATLEALDAEEALRHFYRLWSLKEAWTKARGAALPGALGGVGFAIEDQSLLSRPADATAESGLWLLELPGYSLALCTLNPGLRLRVWAWPGEVLEPPLVACLGAP